MEDFRNLQQILFKQIKERLPAGASMVNEICDILSLTSDSAYRRIRGEKPLVLDEFYKLCRHFNISADEIFAIQNHGDSFVCRIIAAREMGFNGYLKNLHETLLKIQTLQNPEILYFAKDVPLFHHFAFPGLAAFKIFFWSKTVMQMPEFKDLRFDPAGMDQQTFETGRLVMQLYSRIPSAEIWNEETINSLIRQLEYCLDGGMIVHKETALNLCDEIDAMIEHLSAQADAGAKFLPGTDILIPGNFRLYNNEVILGDNSICVTSESLKMTFLTLNVLNLMVTTEERFCVRMEDYLRTMMKKSSLISNDSEKERKRFINLMHYKVHQAKERIRYL